MVVNKTELHDISGKISYLTGDVCESVGSNLKPDEMKKLISVAVFALMIKTLGFSQSYIITYEKRVRPDVSGQLDEIKEKDPALAEQLKDQLEARVILKIGELVHNDGVSSYQENESKETEDKNLNLKSQQTTKNINVRSEERRVGKECRTKQRTRS